MSESIKSYRVELGLEEKNKRGILQSQKKHEKGSAMWNYYQGQLDRSEARLKYIKGRIAALGGSN